MVSQTAYADLEIRILEQQAQGYPVEITLNHEQEFARGSWIPIPCPSLGSNSCNQGRTARGCSDGF